METVDWERLSSLRVAGTGNTGKVKDSVDWEGLAAWISAQHGREPNPHTVRAYRNDLQAFFTFLKNADPLASGEQTPPTLDDLIEFLHLPSEVVNARLAHYEQVLRTEPAQRKKKSKEAETPPPLSSASRQRRLNTISTLLHWAKDQGLRDPDLPVSVPTPSSDSAPTAPTPVLDAVTLERLLDAPDRSTLRGLRDASLLQVLAETGLHRAQLVALNMEHFDRTGRRLRVPSLTQSSSEGSSSAGQEPAGQSARADWLPLSVTCADLLGTYLYATAQGRQDPQVPLFQSLDHRFKHRGGRLKQDAVYKLVCEYGRQIGAAVSPRTLRRTAKERAGDGRG